MRKLRLISVTILFCFLQLVTTSCESARTYNKLPLNSPAPQYFNTSGLQFDKSVMKGSDILTASYSFIIDQPITVESAELSFYPLGKLDPVYSFPIPEWSHTSFQKGQTGEKSISIKPNDINLEPGYYEVSLNFHSASTKISSPQHLLIEYPPGTLRTGTVAVDQQIEKQGYKLTVYSLIMNEDQVMLDTAFTPLDQVNRFFSEMRLKDGRKLQQSDSSGLKGSPDGHVQFVFSPIPKTEKEVTFEITMIEIQKSDGRYGVSGHWAVTIPLP